MQVTILWRRVMGERYPLMINTIERCFSSFFFSFFSFFFLFFLMFSFPSPLLLIDTSKQQNSSQLHLDQINSPHLSKPAIQINGSFLNFFIIIFLQIPTPPNHQVIVIGIVLSEWDINLTTQALVWLTSFFCPTSIPFC